MTGWFTKLFRPHTILADRERETALYTIGQPGCGKSRFIESLAWQDITGGNGAAVIDPAGDLYKRLVFRLAARPDLWPRVVLIDPVSSDWLVRLNPLMAFHGAEPQRVAMFFSDMVERIWKIDPTQAPRMAWVMKNAFMGLSAAGLTLLDLPPFLLDKDFRDAHLARLPPDLQAVRTFFGMEYPKTRGGARMWSMPILNKLGALVFDPDIRAMLLGGKCLDFRRVLDEGLIVLANLPKGLIGEGTSTLVAAFIVAQFQKAAMSRADTDPDNGRNRPLYFLYLDEFQNYTTDNITMILDESRKYRLSLILAHQYLEQLSPNLRSSVLNTSGTIAVMRVGYNDAQQLSRYVFPSFDYRVRSQTTYGVRSVGQFQYLQVDERPQLAGWDGMAQRLANQELRSFWLRRKGGHEPLQLRTMDTPQFALTPELAQRVRELQRVSGERFGVLRRVARQEVLERDQAQPSAAEPVAGKPKRRTQGRTKARDKTPDKGNKKPEKKEGNT